MFLLPGIFQLDSESTVLVTNKGTNGYVVVDAIQLIPAKQK